jgi:hypothetical protein
LLATYKSYVPIAMYTVVCAVVGLGATLLIPDRSKQDITEEFATEGSLKRAGKISPAG